jgi:RHS repeat-associated protein
VERYGYEDFGKPWFMTGGGAPLPGSLVENPYLFTGRRFDPETAYYYYRMRYHEPRTGRFLTRDPIGIWTDPGNHGNGTTYVGNNPFSRVDPRGEFQEPRWTLCSGSERSSVVEALELAENRIVLAFEHLDGLRRQDRDQDELYRKWFGAYKQSRFKKVKKIVRKTRNGIKCKRIKVQCGGDKYCPSNPSWFAYTFVGGEFRIFLCPSFFNMSLGGRAAAIVHETSHDRGRTEDAVWTKQVMGSEAECLWLAAKLPRLAIVNAYNHHRYSKEF